MKGRLSSLKIHLGFLKLTLRKTEVLLAILSGFIFQI
jgi:hypothetical protein